MYRLLNSAMMPVPGRYDYRVLTQEEFVRLVQLADKNCTLDSYIESQQTAEFIQRISGVLPDIWCGQVLCYDGDMLLICKPQYRVDAQGKAQFLVETFIFGLASYHYQEKEG